MDDENLSTRAQVLAALKKVSEIDLNPISGKLRHENPEFWTDSMIETAEQAYRRFLALNLVYPTETVSVNQLLDEYWHQHILDTRKYAEDCHALFGSLLHHYPYFGIGDEEDKAANEAAFAVTQRLWEEAFGSWMVDDSAADVEMRLTLDKVLGGYQEAGDLVSSDVFSVPQGCKNGQHCNKVIVPREIDLHEPLVAVPRVEQ